MLAQNVSNVMVNPKFLATDANNVPVAGAALCTYAAGTNTPLATYSDSGGSVPNNNPVIMDASGRATIYGTGNYKFVLSQPGTGCPNTGSVIWTVDNYFVINQSPTFSTVTATTFHSTASGTTNGVYGTNFFVKGNGNASFSTVVALTTFNSAATGTTPAFLVDTGDVEILGNGNILGQEVNPNQLNLAGYATAGALAAACTACTTPTAGAGLVFYNTTTGTLQYNLGNAGWVDVANVPGADTQVIYNSGGHKLGASAHLTFSGDILTLGGGVATGVIAPLFNASNTGSNNTYQNGSGDFYVTGDGNLGAQSITVNNTAMTVGILTGVASNTDTSGIVTLSGGTKTITWPSGHTYTANSTCIGNDYTALHPVSVGATPTQLIFNGTGSDQIQYICIGAVY